MLRGSAFIKSKYCHAKLFAELKGLSSVKALEYFIASIPLLR